MEERPAQMLSGAHSKKIFHSKEKKKKVEFCITWAGIRKAAFAPCLFASSFLPMYIGLEPSQPACIVITLVKVNIKM